MAVLVHKKFEFGDDDSVLHLRLVIGGDAVSTLCLASSGLEAHLYLHTMAGGHNLSFADIGVEGFGFLFLFSQTLSQGIGRAKGAEDRLLLCAA